MRYAQVGPRLREFRHLRNMTQTEMAEALGVGFSTVAWTETGRVQKPRKLVQRFREVYGADLMQSNFDPEQIPAGGS